jgi:hypothetical protein
MAIATTDPGMAAETMSLPHVECLEIGEMSAEFIPLSRSGRMANAGKATPGTPRRCFRYISLSSNGGPPRFGLNCGHPAYR